MRTIAQWQTYIQGLIKAVYPSADFYPGSVFDTIVLIMSYLLNYVTKVLEYFKNQAWIVTADLPYLIHKANDFGVTVSSGTKAVGTVTFSRVTSSGDVTIPKGTKISVSAQLGSVQFATTETVVITDGSTEVDSDIEAVLAGDEGNVEPLTIRYFVDVIAGVDAVTNESGTSGGVDADNTETLRNKLLYFIQNLSRGTIGALDYRAGVVTGVSSVHIEENPTGLLVYNSDDPKAVYTGTWTTVTDTDYYWGEAKYTETPTDYVEFTFSGEESIMPVFGGVDVASEVEVFLDNVSQGTYSVESEATVIDGDVITCSTAKHVLKIVLNSGKMIIDSFEGLTDNIRYGVVNVFIDDGSGSASWTLLGSVKTALEDWRACGIRHLVKRCEIELIDLEVEIKFAPSVDKVRCKSQIASDIAEYMTTIPAGEVIYINNLYGYINNQVFNGRYQVVTSTITSPTTDTYLEPYTIARLNTITFTEI